MENVIYEPQLGLEGTIDELVDWANKYTSDYSDAALERISELAKIYGKEEKCVKIPLLLKDERKREYETADGVGTPYERMKIDQFLFGRIGYSASDGEGGETEIWSEGDRVVVSLMGIDDRKTWHAAGSCSVKEFMDGEYGWLDSFIGSILYHAKTYDEEED